MIALLALALPLASPAAWLTAGPDSLQWDGFAVVEPVVLEELSGRWGVPPGDLRLEWGAVREDWRPTDEVSVELQGTGTNGYWIVRLQEGDRQLAVRLRAASTSLVSVAARPLERGATLRREDVAFELLEAWGPPKAPTAPEPGWTVRRRVRAGEVLSPPLVTPPDVVESGRPVTVEWVKGPVAITLPGKALGTVSLGEPVYVRTETGERLRGRAIAPGRVRVSDTR